MRRDVLVSAAGIMGGQGLILLITPILARIYTPSEFGIFAAVVSAVGVVATVAALRFDVALPAVSDKDVKKLFHIAIILPVPIILLIASANYFWGPLEIRLLGPANQHVNLILTVALAQTIVAVCQAMNVRRGRFGIGAWLRIVQPLAFFVVAVFASWGLLGALLVSWVITMAVGLLINRSSLFGLSCESSIDVARRSWKYPVISTPFALMDTLALSLPMLFIVSAFGSEDAGNYSQVQRLVAAPVLLLGGAIGQVFFKYAGDLYRRGKSMVPLIIKVVGVLFFVGVILMVFVGFFGESLLGFMLGKGWRTNSSFVLLALAPMVIRAIVSPVSTTFLIVNRVGLGSAWQAAYLLIMALLMIFAKGRLDFETFLFVLTLCEFFSYAFYLYLILLVSHRSSLINQEKIFAET